MKLNNKAIKIINKLNESGFEAYLVGGCVRDFVMEKIPTDYDITTSATPDEIKNLFEKTIDTGIKHGTVSVIFEKEIFEVTTFRCESDYEKNRKPKKVEFVKSLKEDLKRRDFTMNAMCINSKGEIIDLFSGIEDIKNKIIRCVGEAEIRFEEDALRMLRCIRFACRTGFNIEEKTFDAIKNKAHLVKNISVERIKNELDGALMGEFTQKLSLLKETNLEEYILKNARYDLVLNAPKDLNIRWALMLYDNENPKKLLNRLKFDNKSKREIMSYLLNKDTLLINNEGYLRRFIYESKTESFEKYIEFRKAVDSSISYINVKPIFLKDLKINGNTLLEMNFEKNKIGAVLAKLLYMVFENEALNNEETLKEKAREIKCSGD